MILLVSQALSPFLLFSVPVFLSSSCFVLLCSWPPLLFSCSSPLLLLWYPPLLLSSSLPLFFSSSLLLLLLLLSFPPPPPPTSLLSSSYGILSSSSRSLISVAHIPFKFNSLRILSFTIIILSSPPFIKLIIAPYQYDSAWFSMSSQNNDVCLSFLILVCLRTRAWCVSYGEARE